MKLSISTLGLLGACVVGCASTPPPNAKVASTESAVQSARQAGADSTPEASAQLTKAEDELAKARTLIGKGDNDEASAMLTRAQADASFASALSREAKQKAATDAASQRVRAIQSTSAPSMPEPSGR